MGSPPPPECKRGARGRGNISPHRQLELGMGSVFVSDGSISQKSLYEGNPGLACEASVRQETRACCLCSEAKTSQHYFKDAWAHRQVRCGIKCIDCSNPACKAPGCKTCPKCRTAHRANKKCDAVVVALPTRLIPSTLEQVRSWVCLACKPNVCVNWPQCRKALPAKKRQVSGTYECGECQTVKFSQQQSRAHS